MNNKDLVIGSLLNDALKAHQLLEELLLMDNSNLAKGTVKQIKEQRNYYILQLIDLFEDTDYETVHTYDLTGFPN